MNEIDVNNVTLPGQALGVRGAAFAAYQHSEVTTLVARDVPVAKIVPADMSVFTALRDNDPESRISAHIGVFSDEGLARDACQEDVNEDWENQRDMQPGTLRPVLTWKDDESHPLPDGSKYTVIMTTLDVRTGMG